MVKVSDEFTLMIDYAHNAMSTGKSSDNVEGISSVPSCLPVRLWR